MREYCSTEHWEIGGRVDRRLFLKAAAAGGAAVGLNGFVGDFVAQAAQQKVDNRPRMIVMWMGGGPTHIDTWDPKEGSPNHGPWKSAATKVAGVHISEKMPEMAKIFHSHFSLIRGLNTREGAHERGTWLMHTGSPMIPGDDKPGIGSFVSFEHGDPKLSLPPVFAIRTNSHTGGFLGAAHNPFIVNDPMNPVNNLKYYKGLDKTRFKERLDVLSSLESGFEKGRGDAEGIKAHRAMYDKADAMIHDPKIQEILDLKKVDAKTIERYSPAAAGAGAAPKMGMARGGGNGFGMSLLLAKRLITAGVSFVEVGFGGWDNHNGIHPIVEGKCHEMDKPMTSLLEDLQTDGMLKNTLVVWMGDFGRTPRINGNAGRDHWGQSCNVMVAGGGIQPGRTVGDTDKDGYQAAKEEVGIHDVFRSFSKALKLDANKQYYSKTGRPTRIVEAEKGKVLDNLFS